MSRHVGKPTICIGENKDADQLRGYIRGNREADQRLCFRYPDSTIARLLKSEISSFLLFSVLVQADLCRPVRKRHCWFSHEEAHMSVTSEKHVHVMYTTLLNPNFIW